MMEDLRRLSAEPPTRKPAARKARPKAARIFGDDALAVHDLIGALNATPREKPDPLDAELVEGEVGQGPAGPAMGEPCLNVPLGWEGRADGARSVSGSISMRPRPSPDVWRMRGHGRSRLRR